MTSKDTLAKVERACAELLRDAEPVTFPAVAERSGASRTTLYRDENLRSVVEEHRQQGRAPRTLSGVVSEVQHLRDAVEAIAERVRATRSSSAASADPPAPSDLSATATGPQVRVLIGRLIL